VNGTNICGVVSVVLLSAWERAINLGQAALKRCQIGTTWRLGLQCPGFTRPSASKASSAQYTKQAELLHFVWIARHGRAMLASRCLFLTSKKQVVVIEIRTCGI
jgi:hypothetical protein